MNEYYDQNNFEDINVFLDNFLLVVEHLIQSEGRKGKKNWKNEISTTYQKYKI
jgi:hypothetical protein